MSEGVANNEASVMYGVGLGGPFPGIQQLVNPFLGTLADEFAQRKAYIIDYEPKVAVDLYHFPERWVPPPVDARESATRGARAAGGESFPLIANVSFFFLQALGYWAVSKGLDHVWEGLRKAFARTIDRMKSPRTHYDSMTVNLEFWFRPDGLLLRVPIAMTSDEDSERLVSLIKDAMRLAGEFSQSHEMMEPAILTFGIASGRLTREPVVSKGDDPD